MSRVQTLDGRIIKAELKNVRFLGDEGAKEAIAIIDGSERTVYNTVVDGFNDLWVEQVTIETYMKASRELAPGASEDDIKKRILEYYNRHQ